MFKIIPNLDFMNKDPEKRKKIKGFIVECGYSCHISFWCPNGSKCKYKSTYRWHNFSVNFSRFLYRHFNINFHLPIYFQRHRVDLSGTTKCPYQMPRLYTCWDCEYHDGCIDGRCLNEMHAEMIKQGRQSEILYPRDDVIHRKMCKLFKHNEWCQNYDKNTGEIIYE